MHWKNGTTGDRIARQGDQMAFVITKPCIGVKDTACVVVCPCDVIHPTKNEPGYASADQLFIDPTHCIDCGLCVAECPVQAIFQDSDVPAEWFEFIEKNAAYFRSQSESSTT
jgi:NAD-dependent dihydropyrimidine dehydrogenase PreA subunit